MADRVDARYLLDHTLIVSIDQLRQHPRNPRLGHEERVERSIKAHGQFRAIGVASDGVTILFGNHTYLGALAAGEEEMVVHVLPWAWDSVKGMAVMLADNKAGDDSEYNNHDLGEILAEIAARDDAELLASTLFEDHEVERLLADLKKAEDKQLDELLRGDPDSLPAPPKDPYTRPGDLWLLGEHRLICGDATRAATYLPLMAGNEVDFIFTSPPYNVDVSYGEHEDETADWDAYKSFLTAVLVNATALLAGGRALCWNIGVSPKTFPHRQQVLLEELGLEIQRTLVWDKGNTPFPLWYASTRDQATARAFYPNYQHELVVFASKGSLEKGGRVEFDETLVADVFQMGSSNAGKGLAGDAIRTGSTGFKRGKSAHPAAFPVALPLAFINHLADKGAIVLDPFMGSGSTLIACEKSGRRGYGIELDPAYCDIALRRWQEQTGEKPVLAATGEAVDFVNAQERAA